MISCFSAIYPWGLLIVCLSCGLRAEQLPAPQASGPVVPPEKAVAMMSSDHFQERSRGYENLQKWAQENPESSPEALFELWSAIGEPEAKSRLHLLMKQALKQRSHPGKGFLGIRMQDVLAPGNAVGGVAVTSVEPDTPAAKVGLQAGDTIITVDDCDLRQSHIGGNLQNLGTLKLRDYIQSKHPGQEITLHLLRAGKQLKVDVNLAECPPHVDPDWARRKAEFEEFFKHWRREMSK
jgi:hypothetical protein